MVPPNVCSLHYGLCASVAPLSRFQVIAVFMQSECRFCFAIPQAIVWDPMIVQLGVQGVKRLQPVVSRLGRLWDNV